MTTVITTITAPITTITAREIRILTIINDSANKTITEIATRMITRMLRILK